MGQTKYIVLMEVVLPTEFKMKWARCATLEDVEDVKELYLAKYPDMKFEVYEVNKQL